MLHEDNRHEQRDFFDGGGEDSSRRRVNSRLRNQVLEYGAVFWSEELLEPSQSCEFFAYDDSP